MATAPAPQNSTLSDEEVVRWVLAGETSLYELLMRRYNQRLYRVAYSILRDAAEAEDVMQDAYVRAYQHLAQFAGKSSFATWLTRIAVHEALTRAEKRRRLEPIADESELPPMHSATSSSPEDEVAIMEMRTVLEQLILSLPRDYRTVFLLREVEQLSTAETAEALDISEDNVKIRLHRARSLMREELYQKLGDSAPKAFPFMGEQCDAVVARVLAAISVGA